MVVTWVRVGRWHLAVPMAGLLLGVGLAQRTTYISIPVVDWLVPAPMLVALVTVTVGLLPLYSVFGALERTLPRTSLVRGVRVLGATGLVLVAAAPALWYEGAAALVCVLLAAGILAVVLVGEYAWLVGLTLGAAAVVMDAPPDKHVTAVLTAVPLGVWAGLLAVAVAAYWWWGPRDVR